MVRFCKKVIASLLIVSFFAMDVAKAMEPQPNSRSNVGPRLPISSNDRADSSSSPLLAPINGNGAGRHRQPSRGVLLDPPGISLQDLSAVPSVPSAVPVPLGGAAAAVAAAGGASSLALREGMGAASQPIHVQHPYQSPVQQHQIRRTPSPNSPISNPSPPNGAPMSGAAVSTSGSSQGSGGGSGNNSKNNSGPPSPDRRDSPTHGAAGSGAVGIGPKSATHTPPSEGERGSYTPPDVSGMDGSGGKGSHTPPGQKGSPPRLGLDTVPFADLATPAAARVLVISARRATHDDMAVALHEGRPQPFGPLRPEAHTLIPVGGARLNPYAAYLLNGEQDLGMVSRLITGSRGVDPEFLMVLHDNVRSRLTPWQWFAGVIGLRVAASVALATSPVFFHSISPTDKYTNYYFESDAAPVYFFEVALMGTQLVAAAARCIPIFMRWDGPSERRFCLPQSWGEWFLDGLNMFGVYAIGGLLSATFNAYLFYAAEKHAMEVDPSDMSSFIAYLIGNAGAYFLYQIPFNADATYLTVQKRINQRTRTFHEQQNPDLEEQRRTLLGALQELIRLVDVDGLKEDELTDLYNILFNMPLKSTLQLNAQLEMTCEELKEGKRYTSDEIKQLLTKGYLDHPRSEDLPEGGGQPLNESDRKIVIEKILKRSEPLRVLAELLNFHQNHESQVPSVDPEEQVRRHRAHVGAVTLTAFSFPTRYWTIAWAISQATGGSPWDGLPQFFSLLCNFVQSGTEYKRMNESFTRWSGVRETQDSRTHPRCRQCTRGCSFGTGFVMNASYMIASAVAGLAINSSVGRGFFFAGLIFSWGAEWFRNTGVFDGPFQDTITAADRFQTWRGKKPSMEHMRFKIKEAILGLHNKYEFAKHQNLEGVINALRVGNPGLVLFGRSAPTASASNMAKEEEPGKKKRGATLELLPDAAAANGEAVPGVFFREHGLAPGSLATSSKIPGSLQGNTPSAEGRPVGSLSVRITPDGSHLEGKDGHERGTNRNQDEAGAVAGIVTPKPSATLSSADNPLDEPLLTTTKGKAPASSSGSTAALVITFLSILYHLIWLFI